VALERLAFWRLHHDGQALIRHRENEQPVVRLIHNHGKIRELIDGNAELARTR
jgi:hypothetical protein